ncbi:DUF3147 family protein [Microtetraspora niveoalba]|uniref:DUF3147 family protein n=1 Tax=Microtetraspora niveoalba TaxID=46175 RepID=UPI000837A050|nr:DUF3147 family protein [Microtetraspora niveoalba]
MSPSARIRVQPSRLKKVTKREMAVRFVFGAVISVVAALIGRRWGGVTGGVFLAFPAILAATLTLIQHEEHKRAPAVQDARGAMLGAVGMVAYAACVWVLAPRIPAHFALLAGLGVWAAVSAALYFLVWVGFGHRRSGSGR